MQNNRLWNLIALTAITVGISGCGNKDTGKTGVTIDPAKIQAEDANRIKEIENNPNIPPAQKQAILNRMRSREALSEAGRATGGGK